jgi:hypothetical protein
MTSTQNPSTLDDVKVGDTLIVRPKSHWAKDFTREVTHVTPTRVVCSTIAYHKKDGSQVGDRYGSSIRVPRPGELAEMERQDAAEALIRRIVAIVDPQTGVERQRNHARLIAGPIENLEQALALLADSMRDEDES